MWDEAVYDSLEALKPIPNWFLTIKMVEKVKNINLDNNFDEDDHDTIILNRHLA